MCPRCRPRGCHASRSPAPSPISCQTQRKTRKASGGAEHQHPYKRSVQNCTVEGEERQPRAWAAILDSTTPRLLLLYATVSKQCHAAESKSTGCPTTELWDARPPPPRLHCYCCSTCQSASMIWQNECPGFVPPWCCGTHVHHLHDQNEWRYNTCANETPFSLPQHSCMQQHIARSCGGARDQCHCCCFSVLVSPDKT